MATRRRQLPAGARDEWLATAGEDRTARSWTVERWLRYWLASHTSIRPTTKLHYTRDVERVLISTSAGCAWPTSTPDGSAPSLPRSPGPRTTKGQPQSASAMQHLRTMLRAALNLAVREGVIAANPARHIEVPAYRNPTRRYGPMAGSRSGNAPANDLRWRCGPPTNSPPSSNTVTDDALFALWWLTALRGLRRGEACGLRWFELDLEHGVLFVIRNRTTAGYQVVEGEPKTAAGRRPVALDRHTVKT